MIEQDVENIIEDELSRMTQVPEVDLECFNNHRIYPKLVELSTDPGAQSWCSCYLITEHNGESDSVYRIAFDPNKMLFLKEITLEGNIPFYISTLPSLSEAIDGLLS
ncbi:hypothetical protein [Zhongshania aliphaticivorans]|uniref:hypothetical protein n=1 Tax=Zhongshania aliphaticivorans TaxID=1470434 RepID=UPI0012E6B89B|nr:hypothetical protein [Zhongshania aliphaticivorans]CAA0096852.1 Uncharacterised protein [Zhongshania aliphaticivorans]